MDLFSEKIENVLEKKEKMLLPAFSPFPTKFSVLLRQGCETQRFFGQELNEVNDRYHWLFQFTTNKS